MTFDNILNIVVLLILAGVTIAAVSGDNGILTRAADAKGKTEVADIKEELQRKILEEQITNDGDLTETALETILTSKGTLSDETDILDRKLTTTKGSYEIPVRDIWNGTFTGGTSGGGGGSGSGTGLTDTADTKPGAAMPSGATVIEADPSKGIVIKDSKNNEWVWIEVPKTTVFTSAKSSTDYDNIKADLIAYATDYRKGSASQSYSWTDEWYDGCGIADSGTYRTTYQKMLSSVYTNGGFWIGRYEAGVSEPRKGSGAITGLEAKSQPDMYQFNYVTCSQAQTLASAMSTDSSKTSSLMFGIQWDLVCKYLEGKDGLTKANINSDSTNWGNYDNIAVPITSANAKQRASDGTWKAITGTKAQNSMILLTTGASNNTKKMNIYDFAGNAEEWTLEKTSPTYVPCVYRGGSFYSNGSSYPASDRCYDSPYYSYYYRSFRPSLY